jgi:two-component system, OmpR family, response regulator CpxR
VSRPQPLELPSKVLFVDDEREFVQTVSQRLISRDVGTYGVYDGKEALDLIAEDSPEVMVLDLKMPGMHGVEVLRQTKEIAPEIEVIILTGHGTTKDMEECMQLGAFAYMNKPVNIEELSATIKAANDKVHATKTV